MLGGAALLFLVAFLAYYALRLVRVPRREEDAERRLADAVGAEDSQAGPAADALPSGLGLRELYEEAVFLRRANTGEVTFQIGDRPAMPLKYLLEPRARTLLQQVVYLAEQDYGRSWAILAREDEEGRLRLTRLA